MVRAVFPGTFDPIHYGHIDIARRAARLFDEVIVAVYDKPLKSLLFTPEARISLVKESFFGEPKIKVMGYSGLTVEFCKAMDAQVIVRGLRVFSDFELEFRMALANHRLMPEIGGDTRSMVPPHVQQALTHLYQELGDGHVTATSLRD
jgi:pantetheine-phosphate adenylyltransferase